MWLELTRFHYGPDVTLGRLQAGALELATLEEPWLPNPRGPGGSRRGPASRESCVPDGLYQLSPHDGARFQDVWRLSNPELGVFDFPDQRASPEWGRASVLIHSGNTVLDIEGCILVGLNHGRLTVEGQNLPAVLSSRVALNLLRAALGEGGHQLAIRPHPGTVDPGGA